MFAAASRHEHPPPVGGRTTGIPLAAAERVAGRSPWRRDAMR